MFYLETIIFLWKSDNSIEVGWWCTGKQTGVHHSSQNVESQSCSGITHEDRRPVFASHPLPPSRKKFSVEIKSFYFCGCDWRRSCLLSIGLKVKGRRNGETLASLPPWIMLMFDVPIFSVFWCASVFCPLLTCGQNGRNVLMYKGDNAKYVINWADDNDCRKCCGRDLILMCLKLAKIIWLFRIKRNC